MEPQDTGPKFPALLFDDAMNRMEKFFAAIVGRETLDRQETFQAIGYPERSGAAVRALNALRRYGLIEKVGRRYRASALAVRINRPRSTDDALDARRTAAWTPEVFGRIRDRFGPVPLSLPAAEDFLKDLGFEAAVCPRLLKVYVDVVERFGDREGGIAAARPSVSQNASGRQPDAISHVLFEYRMAGGAQVSIRVDGVAQDSTVLSAIEAWLALKRTEIGSSSVARGSPARARR